MKDTSTNKSNDNLSSIFRTWLSQLWYFPLCRKGNYTIWTYERGIENIDIGMGRTTETQHNLLKHHTYIIFKHVTFNQCPILTKVLIYHNVEPQKNSQCWTLQNTIKIYKKLQFRRKPLYKHHFITTLKIKHSCKKLPWAEQAPW